MIIPAAMFIESTVDGYNECAFTQDGTPEKDEIAELTSAIGAASATKLGITFPLSYDFMQGYLIGLQTARTILLTSMALRLAKVDPNKVL